ncbi:MAG: hypothetical protein Q8P01_06195 [bacterium]|nr:hypothetical protein [bacterium]
MKTNLQNIVPMEKQIEKLLRKRLRVKFDEATGVDWIKINTTGVIDFDKPHPPTTDGDSMNLVFVRISDDFASDNDEPEVEKLYHQAYVEWGKKMYYNQQGDTELERQAENNFERIMIGKWRDQEIARMAAASDQAEIPRSSLV